MRAAFPSLLHRERRGRALPQIDYPFPVGGLPASPVNATCDVMASALLGRSVAPAAPEPLVASLGKVMGWFYGASATGPDGCIPQEQACMCRRRVLSTLLTGNLPVGQARNSQVGGGTPGDGPVANDSWGYQSCTETLHAFSTTAGSWRDFQFDEAALAVQCQSFYRVSPKRRALETWGGGYEIGGGGGSNIIWSNGKRDPWHGGGFLRASDALPGGAVFVLQETAHHQDLRLPSAKDPEELKHVRLEEEALIRGWVAAARGTQQS